MNPHNIVGCLVHCLIYIDVVRFMVSGTACGFNSCAPVTVLGATGGPFGFLLSYSLFPVIPRNLQRLEGTNRALIPMDCIVALMFSVRL